MPGLAGVVRQPPAREDGEFHAPRLLLADDDLLNRDYCLAVLEELGLKADCVAGGQEAVEKAKQAGYDIIFMDNQMPGMDGFQATETIRRLEAHLRRSPTVFIIGLTANAAVGDREKCLACGMDDYLSKPFSVAQMREVLLRSGRVSGLTASVVTAPPVKAPVADREVVLIAELEDLDSQLVPGVARKLMIEAMAGLPDKIAELERLCEVANYPELMRLAHTVRGGMSVLRLVALADAASQLEEFAVQHDASGARRMLQELRVNFKLTQPLVDDWLRNKGSHAAL